MLKPQDVMVLIHLVGEKPEWRYQRLAAELGMSTSEVHQALRRAAESGLYEPESRQVFRHALLEFIQHGLRYVYPAKRLPRCYGVPTAHSVAPLADSIVADPDDCVVWPCAQGASFGDGIEPLYRAAPAAASRHPGLHRRLALVDAIRVGRLRERELARRLLEVEFGV